MIAAGITSAFLYGTGSAKALYSGNSNVLSNPFSLSQFPVPSPTETDPTQESPEETGENPENPEESKNPEETKSSEESKSTDESKSPSETDPDNPGESKEDSGETKDDGGNSDIPEDEKIPEEIKGKSGTAYLLPGPEYNKRLKEFLGEDIKNVGLISEANSMGPGIEYITISTEDSMHPVYFFRDQDFNNIFRYYSEAEEIYANRNCSHMYEGFSELGWASNVTEFFKTDYTEDMTAMFKDCAEISTLTGLNKFNMSNVKTVSQMFMGCAKLGSAGGIAEWDTSSIQDTSEMFSGSKSFGSLSGLKNWNVSHVTNMSHMFYGTDIGIVEDLAAWDVSNVKDMSYMFADTDINTFSDSFVSGFIPWNVSNVENMAGMFQDTWFKNFKSLAAWKTTSLTNLDDFNSSTEDHAGYVNVSALAGWDVSKVTTMRNAFKGRTYLDQAPALNDWQLQDNVDMTDAFTESEHNKLPSWYTIPPAAQRPKE